MRTLRKDLVCLVQSSGLGGADLPDLSGDRATLRARLGFTRGRVGSYRLAGCRKNRIFHHPHNAEGPGETTR